MGQSTQAQSVATFNIAPKWQVFFTAFALLLLETVYFRTAIFIHDYLNATLVVSYAVLGIGIGSVVNARIRHLSEQAIGWLVVATSISTVLAIVNFVYFPQWIFFSPVIIAPFAFGIVVIAHYLRCDNAHYIYFYDLLGATAGVLSSKFLIPVLREENTFFVVIVLLLGSSLPLPRPRSVLRLVHGFLLVAAIVALFYNLGTDRFNLANDTRFEQGMIKKKIFRWAPDRIERSFGSNVQRIDVIYQKPTLKYTSYDGLVNDNMNTSPYRSFKYDRRIIYNLVPQPKSLIVGVAAEGVVKPLAAHDAYIVGLEINPAIIRMATSHPYKRFTGNLYDLLDELHQVDARTFLYSDDRVYDLITLINTHMMRTVGQFGPPEYLHTREAVQQYWSHLSDAGTIVLEERLVNEQAEDGILRILQTFAGVMRKNGIERPEDHLFVYNWYGENNSRRGNLYTNIVIKKTPFTEQNWDVVNAWARQMYRRHERKKVMAIYPADTVLQLHQRPNLVPGFSDKITHWVSTQQAGEQGEWGVIDDDIPFPWSGQASRAHLVDTLERTAIICASVLFLILLGWLLSQRGSLGLAFPAHALYVALLGFGFFVIEIGLMNFYQVFTGSPTNAFIFILATLLLSSGLGSLHSHDRSVSYILRSFAAVMVLGVYHILLNKSLILALSASPLWNSMLIAITVFPLGYAMGMALPVGLESAKQHLGAAYAPVLFGINAVSSAFAVVMSVFLSSSYGFQATFAVGLLCYVLAAVLILPYVRQPAA